jgi:hypothetical protein
MPKRSSKKPDDGLDVVQNAKRVFDEAIRRTEEGVNLSISRSTVSLVMAEMGRKGGKIGGKRRLETMTPEQRSDAGKAAAKKRWAKNKKSKT